MPSPDGLPADSLAEALPLDLKLGAAGEFTEAGERRVYRFTLLTPGLLTVEAAGDGVDTRLALLTPLRYSRVAHSDVQALDDPDDLIRVWLPPATYFLELDAMEGSGTYTLTTTFEPGPGVPLDPDFDPFGLDPAGPDVPVKDTELTDLLAVDVNHDERLDLVTVDAANNELHVVIYLGQHGFRLADVLTFPTGDGPSALVTADLNGDGRPDLVVANRNSGDLSVLLGLGDGNFQTGFHFGDNLAGGVLAAADIDGDGHVDLIASDNEGHILVLLADPSLGFDDPERYAVRRLDDDLELSAAPLELLTADLNEDGRSDLVVSTNDGIFVLLNDEGVLGLPQAVASGPGPVSLDVRDIDLDSHLDIVSPNRVYFGDGSGLSWDDTGLLWDPADPLLGAATAVSTGNVRVDFDQNNGVFPDDPTLEVVALTETNKFIHITDVRASRTASALQLAPPPSFPFSPGTVASQVTVADYNGDGVSDIIAVVSVPGGVDYLQLVMSGGRGTFGFGPAQQIVTNVHQTPVVADLDADGVEDILIANTAGELLWRRGRLDEPGTFEAPRPIQVDLDGDGTIAAEETLASLGFAIIDDDPNVPIRIASIDKGQDTVSLLELQGGSFVVTQTLSAGFNGTPLSAGSQGTLPVEVVAGDVNGDSRVDLVVRYAGNSSLGATTVLWLANDAGEYEQAAGPPFRQFFSMSDLLLQDVDDDGRLDLVFTNQFTGELRVQLNLGNQAAPPPGGPPPGGPPGGGPPPGGPSALPQPIFASPVLYRAGTGDYHLTPELAHLTSLDLPNGVVAADVVGNDGMLDLLTFNVASKSLGILAGLGDGRFANPVSLPTPDLAQALAVGHLNGDGFLDVVVLTDSSLCIYLGSETGLEFQSRTYHPGLLPSGLALADVNGDTFLDLLVGNAYGDVLTLLGQGNGNFHPFHSENFIALAVADLDGDGQDDFIFGNPSLDQVSVEFGNAGAEVFQDSGDGLLAPSAVQLSDLNGDGRPDLVVANRGGNNVLVFLGRSDGTFQPLLNPATGLPGFAAGTNPAGVTIQDLNDDLLPDLVVANAGSNDISILLSQGQGDDFTLLPRPRIASGGSGPVSSTVADANGDGIADILVSNSQSDTVAVLVGLGNGFFNDRTPLVLNVGSNPQQALLGNFDGQAGLDLVSVNAGSNNLTYFANLFGPGSAGLNIGSGGDRPLTALAQDVNNDGSLDLVVANNGNGAIALFTGSVTGLTLLQTLQSALTPHPTALALANLDGNFLGLYVGTAGIEAAFYLQFDFHQQSEGSFLLQAALAQATLRGISGQLVAELLPLKGNAASLLQVATLLTTPGLPDFGAEFDPALGGALGFGEDAEEGGDAAVRHETAQLLDQVMGITEAFDHLRLEAQLQEPEGTSARARAAWGEVFRQADEWLDACLPCVNALRQGVRHTTAAVLELVEDLARSLGVEALPFRQERPGPEPASPAETRLLNEPAGKPSPGTRDAPTAADYPWRIALLVCASIWPIWQRNPAAA